MRQPLYFDYTVAQPSAAVALGGARGAALPAGHSVTVSMALVLPDSYHNREVGMFQVYNCMIIITRSPIQISWSITLTIFMLICISAD